MTSTLVQAELDTLAAEEKDAWLGEVWDAFDDDVKIDLLRDACVGHMPPFIPAEFQPWSEYEDFEKEQIIRAAHLIRALANKVQAFK